MLAFHPAKGLEGPHAQTIAGWALRRPNVGYRRTRLGTDDGDFIDVDTLRGQDDAPAVLLMHGLEGSSRSGYLAETARLAHARGWHVVALNFRGCSGEPNQTARSYNSGDHRDAQLALRWAKAQLPRTPFAAIGFSLGGNQLLTLLGEQRAGSGLAAAVAVSVPFELEACTSNLDAGTGLMHAYRMNFVRTMKAKALDIARRFPEVRLDAKAIAKARGIRDVDEAVTAPLFGFESASAYYARCSSARWVEHVRTPTLLLSAEDDPLAPPSLLPTAAMANDFIEHHFTPQGGHVGFVGGTVLKPDFYCERHAVKWLAERLERTASA